MKKSVTIASMRYIYSFLLYSILPFILLRMLWRSWRQSPLHRKRWRERFGIIPQPEYPVDICIHAVSLGEAIAACTLVKAIQTENPHSRIAMTCTTITGSKAIKQHLGDTVYHVYLPYDLPGAVKRFLNTLRPTIMMIMETELWPNLLHYCHKQDIPVLIANARLSEKSARGYARIARFMKSTLAPITQLAAQSIDDAKRFEQLGLPLEKITVTGNIKFDIVIPFDLPDDKGTRPIWIAASTHPGEDEMMLAAHREIISRFPDALLILVPRHPERTSAVRALCDDAGFNTTQRTQAEHWELNTQVYLLDTVGELIDFYAKAKIAFVGGSLVNHGGHNVLEPLALNIPTLSGKNVANFRAICTLLLNANALRIVQDVPALVETLCQLFHDENACENLIHQGQQVLQENRGAIQKHLQLLAAL